MTTLVQRLLGEAYCRGRKGLLQEKATFGAASA